MYGNGVGLPIPFKMNADQKMQYAEVTHLEVTFKASLLLIDHVHVACQNDEVIYVYDYNYNVVASLQTVQRVIRMTLRKAFVHKEYVNAFVPCLSRFLQSIEQFP